jgi:hypothetical protein
MLAFEAAGAVRWTVQGDEPAIATADGGVIGKSGTTYDASGNATGSVNLALLTWTGTAYNPVGPVNQVRANPINVATTLWAFAQLQGGASPFESPQLPANGAAAKEPWLTLEGPTEESFTRPPYNGTALLNCAGGPERPPRPVFYGYQTCEAYRAFSKGANPQPLGAGLEFDERLITVVSNPRNIAGQLKGNGATDSQKILWDDLALGSTTAAPQAGQYSLTVQLVTLRSTEILVRVNCVDFEATAVTVKNITGQYDPNADPSTLCKRNGTN